MRCRKSIASQRITLAGLVIFLLGVTPIGARAQLDDVSGHITYYSTGAPVGAVVVDLQGGTGGATSTSADGQYTFADLASGNWSVTPRKLGDDGSAVSALDAVYVLQAVVGLRTLTAAQRLAGDVSGNGTLSAYDAALILQYRVGLITRFPVAETCGSDWAFIPNPSTAANQQLTQPQMASGSCQPGAIAYQPLSGSATTQDFSAVLFGDCTGSWQPPVAPSPTATVTATQTVSATVTPTPTRTTTPPPTASATPTPPSNAPVIGGCQVFPSDNPWNRDVSGDPVDPNSDTYIANINLGATHLHADFGAPADYGIPYVVVPGSQPFVPITFTDYGDESDPGPYPVPANAPVEAGSDHHVLVLDSGNCFLYELFNASKDAVGAGWSASSGAIFNLGSNALRPDSWTSADAAGLPILPGLVRYDEVAAGALHHAVRFTVWRAQRAWVHPATHYGVSTDPHFIPMGARLRLKASYDISQFTGESRVILEALKTYGMFVADAGTSWFITGATDPRWNDTDLDQLKSVPGSAFEVVQGGTIYTP